MGSSAGQILGIAAPIALSFIAPGLGTALGASLSDAAGLGLGAEASGALGGALVGAGVGAGTAALTGQNVLKSGALGAVTGGIGGAINGAGGISNALGISSAPDASALSSGVGATGLNTTGDFLGGSSLDSAGTGAGINLATGAPTAAATGFSSALNSAAPAAATTGFSSYVPSIIGGTGANPSGTSLLGAAANLYSGIQGTAAAKANTAAEQQANNNALALQTQNFNQTTSNLAPFLATGNEANQQLQTDLGLGSNTSAPGFGSLTAPFTLQSLENTPGYQFQLQQGTQALNQSLGAQGQLFSGAAIKEGQQFATGLADSTYNQAYSNYLAGNNQQFNQLATTSGAGQNAATNQGGFASALSALGTPTLQNTGNITAAGTNAGNTAVNNSLASALGTGVGGAQPSSYGTTGTMTPLAGGGYTMNGMTYNAQGVRIA